MKKEIIRFVEKLDEKHIVTLYVFILLLCVIAISLGIYGQFFYKYAKTDPLMIGINIGMKKTEEELAILKSNFDNKFTNELKENSVGTDISKVKKQDYQNSIVYTAYNFVNTDETYYDVNAQIPLLNINSETAKIINSEIKSEFYDKVNSVMRQTQGNTIYNVAYAAYLNSDVVSIVIKSSLKEEGKPEKVSVKTYNYSITAEELLTLDELIELKQTTTETVQKTINSEIEKVSKNLELIANEYGTVYERNVDSDIYKVESAQNYFLTDDGYVYIIYAYGNEEYTNEMDIVIF